MRKLLSLQPILYSNIEFRENEILITTKLNY